ncbi:MarR family transcriptional regulator [Kytococcus sedentarius]|uniref:MarR family transcriptional regulator n=1 Tax=Kytococcus sedentarius TaxID=1276 RepID=UPI003878FDF3
MTYTEQLKFADQIGRFYVTELDFPPVAGRMLGYLAVCNPAAQSINELAEALLVSRSAIVQAVTLLETRSLVRRSRSRGDRVDKITAVIEVSTFEDDLDASGYADQAVLLREGAELLAAEDDRRPALEEVADFYEFIGARLPQLKAEWRAQRHGSQHAD